MGLTARLARAGAERLHVLVVEGEEAFALRVAAERACLARGWVLALSPADADVLLACAPVEGPFASALNAVFEQMPGPRGRSSVRAEREISAALDQLRDMYVLWTPDADQAEHAPGATDASDHDMSKISTDPSEIDTEVTGQDAADGAADQREKNTDHGQMDHGQMDHGQMDHGQMDHGQMEMGGPGGIPLASGARDRDGLEMDRLHVRLGPVLPAWPAGLTLWCTLAGDVVTQVEVEQTAFRRYPSEEVERAALAARLDAAAQLLVLAGAEALATQVRSVRDTALEVPGSAERTADVAAVHRRVARSWMLRWSLRGLGVVTSSDVDAHGWPSGWEGDVHVRLLRLLDPDTVGAGSVEPEELGLALPLLLPGLELASSRLVVASLVAHAPVRSAAPRAAVR